MAIKAIIFDFDGVVVADSEYIKEDSWEAVVTAIGVKSREPLVRAREKFSKGRGSRYDIIKDALEVLRYPTGQIPTLVSRYAEVYNQAVQAAILQKGVRPIDREGLEKLEKKYPLYINSATPEAAVGETVRNLGLADIFKGVFGQPAKKTENIRRAIAAEKIQPSEMLFVGDGDGDYEAAQSVGCTFIGLANSWNKWVDAKPFPLVRDILEVESAIQQLE